VTEIYIQEVYNSRADVNFSRIYLVVSEFIRIFAMLKYLCGTVDAATIGGICCIYTNGRNPFSGSNRVGQLKGPGGSAQVAKATRSAAHAFCLKEL
jgi:hypothetical protein